MNLIQLVVGDWSNDGHGKMDTFIIECNVDMPTLSKWFAKGEKKLKIKFEDECCSEYEDHTLSKELEEIFLINGWTWKFTPFKINKA